MSRPMLYTFSALALATVLFSQGISHLEAQSDSSDSVEIQNDSVSDSAADSAVGKPERAPVGDTIFSESGLSYVTTKAGAGSRAVNGQEVSVHFVGRIADSGKEFYNSYKENGPLSFALGRGKVIKGCDEGILGMAVGEERTLFIPWDLAYGERGYPLAKIPPKADLIFDVALVGVKKDK
ncbi:MAG: FKBP-type peptidyl-prolyl cis-trans isomerase [Candidatus Zixiibacteriota bacterium]